ncbi:4'-phosphopantetheinyl transferase [Meredithblackwellia eburnea MCA 4105]
MPILGIGTDIVFLPRIRAVVHRRGVDKLAKRILSSREQQDWKQRRQQDTKSGPSESDIRFLAVRWAAKEAAYKAFYPARKLSWKDISVSKDSGVKPSLVVVVDASGSVDPPLTPPSPPPFLDAGLAHSAGSLYATPRDLHPHLSISHDGEYVIAYVVLEQHP